MTKVFGAVVIDYDEYSVLGMYFDEALAQEHVDLYNKSRRFQRAELEEWEVQTKGPTLVYSASIYNEVSGDIRENVMLWSDDEAKHLAKDYFYLSATATPAAWSGIAYADSPEKAKEKLAKGLKMAHNGELVQDLNNPTRHIYKESSD